MSESDKKIQEIQLIEQNLHNILLQKQAFQMELSETDLALKEIEKSGGEVFKIVGQLMVKTDKKTLKDELEGKNKLLSLRLKALEKQETSFAGHLEKIRADFLKKNKK